MSPTTVKRVLPADITSMKTKDLSFDTRNPRLVEAGAPETPKDILRVLWREFAVDEIALSIAANGYFEYEPLFVTQEDGRHVVVEGNRRLAAVRLLIDPKAREDVGATDLPRISSAAQRALDRLPVVICSREKIWQYVGFKHVNGPQQWQSYSKAKYIAWVHNDVKEPLDKIAEQIGDKHSTVQRFYRAWMVLEQAEKAGVFTKEDRFKKHFSFSHLYTGLDYIGIQKFIGLSKDKGFDTKSPVPRAKLQQLGQLCSWLYGSREEGKRPIIDSQNPDLRILSEVLTSRDATAALRSGLPLAVARDIGKGDEKLFREALIAAKQALQQARGKMLTGYRGETDLLELAEEISDLAGRIHKEMEDTPSPRQRRK